MIYRLSALLFACALFAGTAPAQPSWAPGDSAWTEPGIQIYTQADGDSLWVYPRPEGGTWGRAVDDGEWYLHCWNQPADTAHTLSRLKEDVRSQTQVLEWVVEDGQTVKFTPDLLRKAECLNTFILHLDSLQN